jgi:opacity protein-like surface antigen
MKKALLLVTAVLATSLLSFAQDQPRWELFGGYAYGRLDIHDAQNALTQATNAAGLAPLNLGNHLNSSGWDLSLQENPADWFGLVFDIGGNYNKKDVNLAPDLSLPTGTTEVIRLKPSVYTFTGGPQLTYRKNSRFQPFGRVLLGLAYGRASANELTNGVPILQSDIHTSQTAFDFTAGGGLDYHFEKHVAFRASADYIRTYFSSLTQNNLRVSVGLTYRWTNSPAF